MANLRGRKARNAGSGALALGFSDKMKSVAAAAAVLMLATTGTVVVQSQVALPEVSQVLFRLSRWENLEYAKKI
ncbi:hypothetical protein ACEN2A_05500 [Corynebacterium auriscanis]|uniref:hypothetical protein n=1 Tax=Corynebacterium auriscanis TaxID=99807 RepID=UPI003CEDB9D3